jgi:NAD(P)-dependent dehydrogenase (short-subunit alcohol dehydrogenase family)
MRLQCPLLLHRIQRPDPSVLAGVRDLHFTFGENVLHRETEENHFNLAGRTALVAGGGGGIGEAICEEFARAGATVLVADVAAEGAERVAERLPRASTVAMDVSSLESIERAAERIERLDILVNNAGVGLVGTIEQTHPPKFERVMRVNVNSVYYVTQVFLRRLLAVRGSIVNIAFVAGLVGIRDRFAYCASKGAVVAMTRQLAVDYQGGLRVNCICPGTVDSRRGLRRVWGWG